MLRTIKSTKIGTRIVGYTAETTGVGAFSVTNGVGEISAANPNASGAQLDVTLNNPFRRAPVVVASAGVNIANGGSAYINAAPTLNSFTVGTVNGSNANDVGQQHCLAIGNDVASTDNHGSVNGQMFPVLSSRRSARIISGRIASAGTSVSIGTNQLTVSSGGTGIYNVVFKNPFAQAPIVVATPIGGVAGINVRIESVTAGGCQIRTFNAADAAAATDFYMMAFGSNTLGDSVASRGRAIQAQMRKPRLIHARVAYSGGVPSLATPNADVTLVDTGVGILTVNFVNAFAREPVIIVSSINATARYASVIAATSAVAAINIATSAGTLTDPTEVEVLVLGSDDAAEF